MGDTNLEAIFLEFVSAVDPTGMACRLDAGRFHCVAGAPDGIGCS